MSFGPACERCGGNSREYEPDGRPPRCPYCLKYKRRGTREELVEALRAAEHALLATVGHMAGQSILSAERVKELLIETIKKVQDV